MRHFLHSVELSDLVKGVDTGGETSVETENLSFDDGSEWEVVKELGELLPDISVSVLPQAFIVETIPKVKVKEGSAYT